MHTFRPAIIAMLLLILAAAPGVSGADPAPGLRTSHGKPPPLALLVLAGKRHSLDDYRGSVVLVNFFGTWCPSCLQEMPGLLLLAAALKDQPFTVLAVDVGDSPARLRQVFGAQREAFTILLDSGGMAARVWKAQGFPTSFVIDPEGHIRFSAQGPVQWDDPKVGRQIVALLPKAPAAAAGDRHAPGPAARPASGGRKPQPDRDPQAGHRER